MSSAKQTNREMLETSPQVGAPGVAIVHGSPHWHAIGLLSIWSWNGVDQLLLEKWYMMSTSTRQLKLTPGMMRPYADASRGTHRCSW